MARPVARDHDEKRARILGHAARVFAQEGFARASMAQVAGECGISKATIYHYWSGKDALLFDILETYLSSLRDRMAALALEALPPPERLRRLVAEILRAYEGMDDEHKIQTEGMARLAPERQRVLKTHQREMLAIMGAVLRANAPGSFEGAAGEAKLRQAVMSVFGMLNWFYMWNRNATRAARDDYAETVTRLTLGGLAAL